MYGRLVTPHLAIVAANCVGAGFLLLWIPSNEASSIKVIQFQMTIY
jgi:hypothetical protein